ncbi:hypothetical protein D9M68_968250 [compost metagenome]
MTFSGNGHGETFELNYAKAKVSGGQRGNLVRDEFRGQSGTSFDSLSVQALILVCECQRTVSHANWLLVTGLLI